MTDWLDDYRDDGVRDWAPPTWRDIAKNDAQYERRIARLLKTITDLRHDLAVARGEPVAPRRPDNDLTPRSQCAVRTYDKEEIR